MKLVFSFLFLIPIVFSLPREQPAIQRYYVPKPSSSDSYPTLDIKPTRFYPEFRRVRSATYPERERKTLRLDRKTLDLLGIPSRRSKTVELLAKPVSKGSKNSHALSMDSDLLDRSKQPTILRIPKSLLVDDRPIPNSDRTRKLVLSSKPKESYSRKPRRLRLVRRKPKSESTRDVPNAIDYSDMQGSFSEAVPTIAIPSFESNRIEPRKTRRVRLVRTKEPKLRTRSEAVQLPEKILKKARLSPTYISLESENPLKVEKEIEMIIPLENIPEIRSLARKQKALSGRKKKLLPVPQASKIHEAKVLPPSSMIPSEKTSTSLNEEFGMKSYSGKPRPKYKRRTRRLPYRDSRRSYSGTIKRLSYDGSAPSRKRKVRRVLYSDEDYPFIPYDYEYAIKDQYSNSFFGHREAKDLDMTEGRYFIQLPDSRLMTVEYIADDSGYHPHISYEGTAIYPEEDRYI